MIQLITDTGTDALDPTNGGGLASMIGPNINRRDISATKSLVNVKFAETQRQLLAEQETLQIIEEERLRLATVKDVRFDDSRQELQIDFTLENAAGQVAFVRI